MAVWYHADITRQRLGRHLVRPLTTACLANAAGICASSASLVRRSPILAPHQAKAEVISFGIAAEPWASVVPRRDGAFIFVGRLVPYKGVDVLLRALAAVPEATLVVVGEGPEETALQTLAEDLGVRQRIELVGTLAETEIAELLQGARALVLPSVDASEAFGLVQLEAMAAGVPVVVTDLPTGVPEVGVPDETGLLVAPGDVEALAAAMNCLQADAALRQRLGEGGRRHFARHYSRQVMIEHLVGWYAEILAQPGTREGTT